MPENRGKNFENVIRRAFENISDTSVLRLPDPTNGYLGIRNISDFVIYHYPYQYFIECKSIHGNTFPLNNITKNQWDGMLEMSSIAGVVAGVIIWWVDKDITKFFPIHTLYDEKLKGSKSIRFDGEYGIGWQYEDKFVPIIDLKEKKKRIFFDYDMKDFFNHFE